MTNVYPTNHSHRWLGAGAMSIGIFFILIYIFAIDEPLPIRLIMMIPVIGVVCFLKAWSSLAGVIERVPKEEQIRIGFAVPEDFTMVLKEKPE